MTNEELLTDLKQSIEATISQQMSGFATKDDLAGLATKNDLNGLRVELKADIKELKADIALLDEKLDTIQDAIAETITHNAEVTDTTLKDHEQRLRRLEHRPA